MSVELIILNLALIFFFLLMILFTILIYLNIFYIARLKVPPLSTGGKALKKILENVDFKSKKKFYDLGSGSGKLISCVANRFPNLECTGIEYNPVAYFFAKIRNIFSKQKVDYRRNDFFETDLGNVDIIYTYLFPGVMNRLETKFSNELKKGTLVVANSFSLKSKEPKAVFKGKIGGLDTIYIYEY